MQSDNKNFGMDGGKEEKKASQRKEKKDEGLIEEEAFIFTFGPLIYILIDSNTYK